MSTLVDLAGVPRRDLRYVLFRMRNGTESAADMPEKFLHFVEPLRELLASQGVEIEQFEIGWDLGIDDIDTMHTRPNKWFLWGIPKLTAVTIGDNSTRGLATVVESGFGTITPTGPKFTRADYARILEGVSARKGW